MPTWGEILEEVKASAQERGGLPDLDGIRRKYLAEVYERTKRPTILYATDWVSGGTVESGITLEDMQGLMEVSKGLKGPALDLILHSPGGSAEATASIVSYLRSRFDEIRVFVPLAAMSAATMWTLAGDQIVMGKHSQLGPIDPQLVTPQGNVPARAILDQFERAKKECADNPALLGAWLPILQQYGPALIEQCENAEKLARRLAEEWLAAYMFRRCRNRKQLARKIAGYFADHRRHQSHALGITREAAREQGLVIVDLEADEDLQDAVLSVHHAAMHTLQGPAVKIVENHEGRGYFKLAQAMQVQVPVMAPQQPQPPLQPPIQPLVAPPAGP